MKKIRRDFIFLLLPAGTTLHFKIFRVYTCLLNVIK
jgi:hypothetical protein